ncbi:MULTISPECIES: competence type IV pilus ATPase ComGA [Mesobacillus]|uniref:Competence protein ComG n=1 Tax=Mesobacillus subterraneus TaxID=285983 RepID=A0A0D6Z6D5_9BACI|nr:MULTISPECIES: competence type IV pilus ATPase ComGA [Mesobacillus]KIY21152.1 competence protein ComG [Mesobacillus subterraneus]
MVKSIELLAENILKDALKSGASDIHIIPHEKDTLIKFRLGNQLLPRYTLDQGDCERLISHFKFTASMDIGEKRRPQSGAFSYQDHDQKIGLRISTLPAYLNESMVIRLLPEQKQIPSYQLSLFPSTSKKLISLLKHAHGLIIFTGPTGSGKTTTLYSMLSETSEMVHRNVITLEDPIEKPSEAVLQVQVNERAGVSYAAGLKAILRHDPDIIMVGEIRDKETAETAIRASLTGHLVLTTMHTRDAKGAIYRLSEFGISWLEIEQTLIAVTAQRLVELTCPYCEDACSPFCYSSGSGKRGNVFEILTGRDLSAALKEAKGEHQNYHYKTLKDAIKKGIALGFIKESEYQRWVLNEGE